MNCILLKLPRYPQSLLIEHTKHRRSAAKLLSIGGARAARMRAPAAFNPGAVRSRLGGILPGHGRRQASCPQGYPDAVSARQNIKPIGVQGATHLYLPSTPRNREALVPPWRDPARSRVP